MTSYQKNQPSLAASQDAFETRRLNVVFLGIVAHLPCRPEPRHRFDEIARTEQRRNHPGADAIADSRTVLRAAVATGNATIVNQTRRAIAQYWNECRDSALREVVPEDATSLNETLIGFHKESCEALNAVAVAGVEKSTSAMEAAVREIREMDDCGETLVEQLQSSILQSQGRRHMQVAR